MSDIKETKPVVNGKETTEEELQKLKQDKNVRLHEEAPNKFRVLNRLTE